jgi:phage terminase large subunit
MALWCIWNIMNYKNSNLLVVRKVYRTLKDSCFTELKWAIKRLKVDKYWKIKHSPLEMEYIPSGQKILFKGLDDPLKIASITVQTGSLCWVWVEEAFEISKEKDFDMLDESIRGFVNPPLFKQMTLTFNPWNERHWLKSRFFDNENPDIFTKTTNYLCNEWLDSADLAKFERMKHHNPRRYKVAGLGEWGVAEGLVYENWHEKDFNIDDIRHRGGVQSAFGLDFGYTNDPSALCCCMIDIKSNEIYIFDELYKKGLTNRELFNEICHLGYKKERIIADSAEPKSIEELYQLGLNRVRAAEKGKDSVIHGIQFIQGFTIYVHPRCVNFLTEIGNYAWDSDKFGNKINRPIGEFNHLMDALRYALEDFSKVMAFSF